MICKGGRHILMIGLSILIFVSISQAQQPLIQITTPVNNSLATEGTTITISVSVDA